MPSRLAIRRHRAAALREGEDFIGSKVLSISAGLAMLRQNNHTPELWLCPEHLGPNLAGGPEIRQRLPPSPSLDPRASTLLQGRAGHLLRNLSFFTSRLLTSLFNFFMSLVSSSFCASFTGAGAGPTLVSNVMSDLRFRKPISTVRSCQPIFGRDQKSAQGCLPNGAALILLGRMTQTAARIAVAWQAIWVTHQ